MHRVEDEYDEDRMMEDFNKVFGNPEENPIVIRGIYEEGLEGNDEH